MLNKMMKSNKNQSDLATGRDAEGGATRDDSMG
jgi:hypothetical protein